MVKTKVWTVMNKFVRSKNQNKMKKITIVFTLLIIAFGTVLAQESNVTNKEVSISRSNENGVEKIHVKVVQQRPTQLAVIDLAGKQVYTSELTTFGGVFNEEIDLSENGRGMYLLKISQGKKMVTRKIVID